MFNKLKDIAYLVFPACAGVSLAEAVVGADPMSFPRVCGGEPIKSEKPDSMTWFSPRVRG